MITALRASGMLATYSEAGVLTAADVHVATRLGVLSGEADERVLLAIALLVRGTRLGSVVLDLSDVAETVTADPEADVELPAVLPWPEVESWVSACASSPVVLGGESGAPVHLVGSRLWLDRYWRQEELVAVDLSARADDAPDDVDAERLSHDLDELFASPDDADQRAATEIAATSRVSVIAGGPGTGKTTTIARLIIALWRQHPALRIALAAPTARAAGRVEEAIHAAEVGEADRTALAALSASTIHRLLGWRPGGRFRHNRDNRLAYDVVIIDECSMVSLTLMARLVEALSPSARLVLVGDPDQLTSVEAGAVLADLVEAASLQRAVVPLHTVRRYEAGGPIARLAAEVRAGRADQALAMLTSASEGVVFCSTADEDQLSETALELLRQSSEYEREVIAAARAGDIDGALAALDRHRLLCAHRSGPRGERWWSDATERWLGASDPTFVPRLDARYAGQPLLVTANDYENQLWNSDVGVVVQQDDELVAAFRRSPEPIIVPLVRLSAVRPMHAMTVHRAQGSQFDEVTVLLPYASSPLATRQTFYTAITRAAKQVRIIGSEEAVLDCVSRPAARATGLRDRLDGSLA